MPLVQMFRGNVFVGLAMCACLAAILWCIFLVPKLARGRERFLVGLIGLISIFQGLRILKDAGVWALPRFSSLTDLATLIVSGLYLVALFVVHVFGEEHRRTTLRLRLSEANEKPPTVFGRTQSPRIEAVRQQQGQSS
jgi:phosphatidylserine synthase